VATASPEWVAANGIRGNLVQFFSHKLLTVIHSHLRELHVITADSGWPQGDLVVSVQIQYPDRSPPRSCLAANIGAVPREVIMPPLPSRVKEFDD
jgi:hypothetical protein